MAAIRDTKTAPAAEVILCYGAWFHTAALLRAGGCVRAKGGRHE